MSVPSFISIALLVLTFQSSTQCTMEKQFCDAILKNDWASLKIIVDKKLDFIDIKDIQMLNFEPIKKWLENHACVSSVEIVPGMLRSDPPIKIFEVTVIDPDQKSRKIEIGIQVFPDKLRFNYK